MSRQLKLELVTLALYLFVLLRMDTRDGFRTAAQLVRWYGNRCRDIGNAAYTQAIRADNAYKELIAP